MDSNIGLEELTLCTLAQVYISPGTLHSASINSIAWAPHELGLLLAAASSDGTISITEYSPTTASWDATKVRLFKECVLMLLFLSSNGAGALSAELRNRASFDLHARYTMPYFVEIWPGLQRSSF